MTGQHRATQRREPPATTLADPDAALRAWLRESAQAHPRRGWAVDFQLDATTDGRPVKILSIVDEHTPANASAGWSTARSPPTS